MRFGGQDLRNLQEIAAACDGYRVVTPKDFAAFEDTVVYRHDRPGQGVRRDDRRIRRVCRHILRRGNLQLFFPRRLQYASGSGDSPRMILCSSSAGRVKSSSPSSDVIFGA